LGRRSSDDVSLALQSADRLPNSQRLVEPSGAAMLILELLEALYRLGQELAPRGTDAGLEPSDVCRMPLEDRGQPAVGLIGSFGNRRWDRLRRRERRQLTDGGGSRHQGRNDHDDPPAFPRDAHHPLPLR
jgi:hypothetical protein